MNDLEVKKIRKRLKLTQDEFGKRIGVTRDTIINYEKGGVIPESKLELLRSLSNSIVNDSQEVNKLTNYHPQNDTLIPFYDVDFIAGTIFEAVETQTVTPEYYMDIPDFRGCTAFRAYSDSMEGIIKSGSVLFGTKIEEWDVHLEFGQIYGIVCKDSRKYLKYIKKYRENPKDYFLLESENKFYDEFEIPKDYIRSIWLIHGHLNKRV